MNATIGRSLPRNGIGRGIRAVDPVTHVAFHAGARQFGGGSLGGFLGARRSCPAGFATVVGNANFYTVLLIAHGCVDKGTDH